MKHCLRFTHDETSAKISKMLAYVHKKHTHTKKKKRTLEKPILEYTNMTFNDRTGEQQQKRKVLMFFISP